MLHEGVVHLVHLCAVMLTRRASAVQLLEGAAKARRQRANGEVGGGVPGLSVRCTTCAHVEDVSRKGGVSRRLYGADGVRLCQSLHLVERGSRVIDPRSLGLQPFIGREVCTNVEAADVLERLRDALEHEHDAFGHLAAGVAATERSTYLVSL